MFAKRCKAMPKTISEITRTEEACKALCVARIKRDQVLVETGQYKQPPPPPRVTYTMRERQSDMLDSPGLVFEEAAKLAHHTKE